MSHVKAGGATRQASPRPGKRRGIKKFGGEVVKTGQIIIRPHTCWNQCRNRS